MGQTTNGHPHQVRQTTQQSPESFMPAPGVELVPDLSAITSKFKSSRPNPFENLLRLQKQDSQSSTSACSSSSQKKLEPIFVNERGIEEGSGGEVNEVKDDAANGGLKVKEQSEAEEDLALGSHKTEPKVTPFKLKIPPKVEVASGSEIESSSELSAKLVVKKKKKSKKSKKKERREYREEEEELVAKDRKPPKGRSKKSWSTTSKLSQPKNRLIRLHV